MKTLNLLAAARLFHEMGGESMNHVTHAALEKAARMIEKRAKGLIGHEQPSWPRLAQSTAARKSSGYDTPLLETGEMRDSIEHTSSPHEAHIGSNSDIAVYQELGTSRIPPRSFLALAAMQEGPAVAHMIGEKIRDHLESHSDLSEIWHLLKEAAHEVKELGEDFGEMAADEKGSKR